MRKALLVVAGGIALGGVAYAFYLLSAFGLAGECSDEIKTEAPSADGAYKAAFFERNCGATTNLASIVSVRRHDDRFDGDNDAAILVIDGRCAVDLAWSGCALGVSYARPCTVVKRSTSWRDVTIRFSQL